MDPTNPSETTLNSINNSGAQKLEEISNETVINEKKNHPHHHHQLTMSIKKMDMKMIFPIMMIPNLMHNNYLNY